MGIIEKFENVNVEMKKKEYNKKLAIMQLKMTFLQRELRNRKVRLIMLFEGWDASGKGGAIKRFVEKLDPRGLKVFPIGAPSQDELMHNYLWRFWSRLPRKGEIVIFDRSWYGRVLVERVEGFAREEEWKRAYEEINNFEKLLVNGGDLMLKFFIVISKQEQLNRFDARKDDPFKSWKITEEDWRNREKWDDYIEAAEELYDKTSTDYCPWYIISGNNKRFSRTEVLKTVVREVEEKLEINPDTFYPEFLYKKAIKNA